MTPDVSTIVNLGIGGFAIWILYLQSKKSAESGDKMLARFKEKDQELITEIDKRDKRNEDAQKVFHDFAIKTHESMAKQINENTKALTTFSASVQENTRTLAKVNEHLNGPHTNILIQQNEKQKTE